MSENDPICITSPGDFVAAIPVLLGFHPRESLVAVKVADTSDRVVWTMRVDLDSPSAEVSRQLLDLAARTGGGRVLLATFAATPPTGPGLVEALLGDLQTAGVHVSDALLVSGGRFWSAMCSDPACCPSEGRPVPDGTTVLEATRVAAGARAVAGSRQELLDAYRLRPDLAPSPESFDRAAVLLTGSKWQRADTAKSLLVGLDHPGALEADTAAAGLMLLLQDVRVRDLTLAAVVCGPEPEGPVDTLARVALRAPDDFRPRLAGAAAAALAATGANAVASWAMVEHAGDDSLALLIGEALHHCLEPSIIAETFSDAVAVMIANDDCADRQAG